MRKHIKSKFAVYRFINWNPKNNTNKTILPHGNVLITYIFANSLSQAQDWYQIPLKDYWEHIKGNIYRGRGCGTLYIQEKSTARLPYISNKRKVFNDENDIHTYIS